MSMLNKNNYNIVDNITEYSLRIYQEVYNPAEYSGKTAPEGYEDRNKIVGSGTEADPYLISSAVELKWFNDQIQDNQSICATLKNDIILNKNVLDANYNLNGDGSQFEEWACHEYNGHFNGNGHFINGIYINNEGESGGLFGAIHTECIIENLGTKDSYIHTRRHTGGITSWVHNGAI